jgi:transcription elongation GreA/GreB family factor
LGAGDGDVEKNIIAYLSETAKALIGKQVGDVLDVPTETQGVNRKVKIVSIRGYAQA